METIRAQRVNELLLPQWNFMCSYLSSRYDNGGKHEWSEITKKWWSKLTSEIDGMLLPTIAQAVSIKKNERTYEEIINYFFDIELHTLNYDLLRRVCIYAERNISALLEAVDRFHKDIHEITKHIVTGSSRHHFIKKIEYIDSDRHNNCRTALKFTLNKSILIYKPRSHSPDLIFNKIVNLLCLSSIINTIKCLDMGSHGWVEFIRHSRCVSEKKEYEYFYKCGSLLAIAQIIGYCDGHFENLIATDNGPYLVDLETSFSSKTLKTIIEKDMNSLFYTGLIEDDSEERSTSAMIAFSKKTRIMYQPYAINDGSNKLRISYTKFVTSKNNNTPFMQSTPLNFRHWAKLIEGYKFTANIILSYKRLLLESDVLNLLVSSTKVRVILRPTKLYYCLLRMSQQPHFSGWDEIKNILSDSEFKNTNIISYELDALKRGDIPYFYKSAKRNNYIYDGDDNCTHYETESVASQFYLCLVAFNVDNIHKNTLTLDIIHERLILTKNSINDHARSKS